MSANVECTSHDGDVTKSFKMASVFWREEKIVYYTLYLC